jgi:hypothetical protein
MFDCKNHDLGCGILALDAQELRLHETLCVYNRIICVNEGCKESIFIKDVESHVSLCRYYKCEASDYGCQFVGPICGVVDHEVLCGVLIKKRGIRTDIAEVTTKVFSHATEAMREYRDRRIGLSPLNIEDLHPPNPMHLTEFEPHS